jgi:hypothetical protein
VLLITVCLSYLHHTLRQLELFELS